MQIEPKNPDQLDLQLSGAEQAENLARDTSDLAKLSSEVIEKGLVRELRPVFVYDKTLSKAKQGNALRQEKFRVEREKQGLKTGLVPVEVLEKVKAFGGGAEGWTKFLAISDTKDGGKVTAESVPAAVDESIVQKLTEDNQFLVTEVSQMKSEIDDLTARLAIKPLVQEVVKTETIYKEKVVIQHDLKLRPEQRDALKVGEKVASLTGWKLKIVRFLAGI